ncbi:MAG: hypothetical protein HUU31_14455 [Anaerolineae bacterium]|nr:hypothetical protein [Anaerolineae bacterium]
MTDSSQQSIVPAGNNQVDIQRFESTLLAHIDSLGLPTDSVFVPVAERMDVFQNVPNVVGRIPNELLPQSIYVSKFLAAAAAGLFDAALNYMWDQTIVELRRRVAQYDLSYFFDLVVPDPNRRKKLSTEADLEKIEDSELIKGAFDIELISEFGFKHLDFIRYMRNRASAAHPNQNEITGLQLIGWLQTCIVHVINLPLSNVVVKIKELLTNIKTNRLTEPDARQIAVFFTDLTQDRVNVLCSGFFGIYTDSDTTTQTQQNIRLLLPHLWDRVDEATRFQFGIKYAQFLARNEQQRQLLARQFLETVSAFSYVPDDILAAEIEDAVQNLLNAHRNLNNFYNEPAFARQLQRLVGQTGKIPAKVIQPYVLGVVEVYLTNGNGIAWNAEPTYVALMQQFDPRQSLIAAVAFRSPTIASKLQFPLCQKKYLELLELMVTQVANPAVKELIQDVQKALANKTSPERLREDRGLSQKIDNLRKILDV